jgi:phage terminase large subunit
MKPLLIVSVIAVASLSAAQSAQTFVGTITDDMCAKEGHASMRMGPTDAECTKACITAHGAEYVLADGKNVYVLSDQKAPEKFAGQRVRVMGTLNVKTRTIQVQSMALAK